MVLLDDLKDTYNHLHSTLIKYKGDKREYKLYKKVIYIPL